MPPDQAFRPCVLIPHFDNPNTLRGVVEGALQHVDAVIVVDDGSGPAGVAAVEELAQIADVQLLERNRGKGAACLRGFERAHELGFTHAIQVDADGQHALDDLPNFLAAARTRPEALVCGVPIFDENAPRSRVVGRKISIFWVNLEVGRGVIRDPLYGYRVYPVQAALDSGFRAMRMGFDTDIAVRMVWNGVPTLHLATPVTYFDRAEGGVSHFRAGGDSWVLFKLHTGLFLRSLLRRLRS